MPKTQEIFAKSNPNDATARGSVISITQTIGKGVFEIIGLSITPTALQPFAECMVEYQSTFANKEGYTLGLAHGFITDQHPLIADVPKWIVGPGVIYAWSIAPIANATIEMYLVLRGEVLQ